MSIRAKLVKKREETDVQEAINRFKQRVSEDFEPERPKDIREACLTLLEKHFKDGIPEGPLLDLVREVSPAALAEFIKQSPIIYSELHFPEALESR